VVSDGGDCGDGGGRGSGCGVSGSGFRSQLVRLQR